MSRTLSELQQRLYDKLAETPNEDVEIYVLYEATFIVNVHRRTPKGELILGEAVRNMQQRLGSVVARTNEKLEGSKERVVPGRLKQTYRLRVKDT